MVAFLSQHPLRPLACIAAIVALTFAGPAEAAKKKKKKDAATEGVIAGVVKNQEGEILAGTMVTATSSGAEGFRAEVATDKKGEFEIRIPEAAGEYTVRLVKKGYAAFETPITLNAGDQQSIEFKLIDEAAGRRKEAVDAYNAGAKAFNDGDSAKAKALFEKAISLDGALPEPLLAVADIYLTEGADQQAAAAADRYLALKPDDQKGQIVAHEAHRKLGNTDRVEELRQALGETDISSQLAVQVFNEGAMASQKGDWDGAIAKFNEALELNPSLPAPMAALTQIYYSREKLDEAAAMIDKLLEIEPDNVQGHRYRFLVLDAQGGDAAGVNAALDAYIEADPEGAAQVLYQRADMDFRAGSIDAARRALLKVVELAPELPRAHSTLGLVYASTDTAKAKQHLQKFLELAPDDPEAGTAKEMMSYF